MSRYLIPLGISASVLAQLPTSTWEQMSALGLMGVVLIWLVTKTLPTKDLQAVALQRKTTELAEKFADLTATQTAAIATMNENMLRVGADLARAIGETGQVLTGLQQHCRAVSQTDKPA